MFLGVRRSARPPAARAAIRPAAVPESQPRRCMAAVCHGHGRGHHGPTGESDTEEEDETAEWPAGRTAATFERHKRFADLDAGASGRQAL